MTEYTLEVICQGRLFYELCLLSLQYLNFCLKASMVAFGKVPVFSLQNTLSHFLHIFDLVHPFKVSLDCRTFSFH